MDISNWLLESHYRSTKQATSASGGHDRQVPAWAATRDEVEKRMDGALSAVGKLPRHQISLKTIVRNTVVTELPQNAFWTVAMPSAL